MERSDNWCCFFGSRKINKVILDLICSAKKSIYISHPFINFSFFPQKLTQAINKINVEVNILVSSSSIIDDGNLSSKISVKIVENFGPTYGQEFIPWTTTVCDAVDNKEMKNLMESKIYQYSQSYIIIDSSILIFGNGISKIFSTEEKDEKGMIVIGKANKEFYEYVEKSWKTCGKSSYSGGIINNNICGSSINNNISSGSSGSSESIMCQWIKESSNYIYIESSLFISHQETKNKVVDQLIKRLIRAYENESDLFQCVIIIKQDFSINTPFESSLYILDKINYTAKYIENELERSNIAPGLLKNRIFLGISNDTSNSDNTNYLIKDGNQCLLGQSSICDHSLIDGKNSELNFILEDCKKIQNLQKFLFSSDDGFGDFFQQCVEKKSRFQGYKFWKDDDDYFSYCKNYDFILQKLLGKCYYT
jgi:hypothetical protein